MLDTTESALIVRMDRVVCAAKGLFYAKREADADQLAMTCCVKELRAALEDLETSTNMKFDTKAYVAELVAAEGTNSDRSI